MSTPEIVSYKVEYIQEATLAIPIPQRYAFVQKVTPAHKYDPFHPFVSSSFLFLLSIRDAWRIQDLLVILVSTCDLRLYNCIYTGADAGIKMQEEHSYNNYEAAAQNRSMLAQRSSLAQNLSGTKRVSQSSAKSAIRPERGKPFPRETRVD
jgi:hypothetical protein